uniref:Uncharacterized protein n=1 Tax=Rhizophora mucronata TaxID=61149 RepID=A0A2P2PHL6_RHIMU
MFDILIHLMAIKLDTHKASN